MSGRRWRFPLLRVGLLTAIVFAAIWAAGRGDLSGEVEITDGDSIKVAGTRVRLYGIDAPELDQTCLDRTGATYACGTVGRSLTLRTASVRGS